MWERCHAMMAERSADPYERPSILVPRFLLDGHRDRLEATCAGRARIIADDEPASSGEDPIDVEVAVTGIDQAMLDRAIEGSALGWVHSVSAGVEHLPLSRMAERGILLTSSAGAYASAMTEYAVAAMIMLARRLPSWLAAQADGRWLEGDAFAASTLRGKQLGIVGYGAVGRELATAARALGMRVWATKRSPLFLSGEPLDRLLPADGLHDLLVASDVVVLCASLNRTTHHLIGREQLASMKPTATLVNVARGGLIDEDALVAALHAGTLAGAMLDVTAQEPLPPDDPLWSTPNLFITPHISGNAPESWDRQVGFFLRNLELYLAGEPERMGNLLAYSAVG
jgi:phosphoglycerate dehydrogenase-like enzyme